MKYLIFPILWVLEKVRIYALERQPFSVTLFLSPLLPFYSWLGKRKAYRVYNKAKSRVPAYRKFLDKNGGKNITVDTFSSLPEMSKDAYVKKYSIESRCVDGVIPTAGVIVDESSGTSGKPTNWVRGYDERLGVKNMLQIAFRHRFGKKKVIVINAFALGVRATGINVSISLVDVAILKSTGPDVEKIINTMEFFGPEYEYILMGYPPFLKSLVDTSTFNWDNYQIRAVYGGEGISEEMRSYLMTYFQGIIGSYGASDLEINMAAETKFTIALRHLIANNSDLAKALTKIEYGVLPSIFQYHPLDYYIETNEHGELVITINRSTNISPRVRYNIQDLGHTLSVSEVRKILAEYGMDTSSLPPTINFPLLFHYGRSTGAIAYYGCKLHPADMQEVIARLKGLTSVINSFSYAIEENGDHDKLLTIKVELYAGYEASDYESYADSIVDSLMEVNQDFKEAYSFVPAEIKPQVRFFTFKTDSFALENDNIKKRYFVTEK